MLQVACSVIVSGLMFNKIVVVKRVITATLAKITGDEKMKEKIRSRNNGVGHHRVTMGWFCTSE